MKTIIFILLIVTLIVFLGNVMSTAEQPRYRIVESEHHIEVRDYDPMIIAEVQITGERKEAITKGFRILADYIFGNNRSKTKLGMTAPVISEPNEKIPMTAPVMQQKEHDQWIVRFIMPSKYDLETLPTPNSSEINLIPIPARRYAVVRFSGLATESSIQDHISELEKYLAKHRLNPKGNPIMAFYNPPWTLPFLRRNEVMIEIESVNFDK